MSPRTAIRLTRYLILDRALEVAEKTATKPAEPLTGAALGHALGVDRSAIWRHFEDKDDLLLAVADRLIGIVHSELDLSLPPKDLMENVFWSFNGVFARFPYVGSELGPRYFTAENGNRTWELILGSLQALGVPDEHLALEFRVFADVMVALAASNALQQQMTAERRERDISKARTAIYGLSADEFPIIVSGIERYVATSDEEIGRGFLDSYWAGIARYQRPSA